jgi:hypothetical protein
MDLEGMDVRAGPEEEHHDQRMGKADLAAVDDAIADAFDEGEDVMISMVEDNPLERVLRVQVLVAILDSYFPL